jgi:RNA polymerase sigma-70 factor (ECF subfamily)
MTALSHGASDPAALVPRAVAGDAAAFAALVARCKPTVYRWAVALCGDEDDAEDVAQEVFVQVHRRLATFRGDGPFDAWLYRITRRTLLRSRRRAVPRPPPGAQAVDVYVTDPGARVDRVRAVELIREIASTLPMRQREVFVLCDLEGRTPAEVARLMNLRDVSVRASLFKARASIRRTMLAKHPRYTEHQG